jgi:hypothetical protein
MSQPTSISFRALCAELVNELHDYKVANEQHDDALVYRARAALAQSEPEGVGGGPPAVTSSALLHPAYEPDDGSADGAQMVGMAWWRPVMGCDSLQLVVDNARNILRSRWAHPTIEPVPVAERFEFSVFNSEYEEQAGGTAPTYAEALSYGQHYLSQYSQDGPHSLEIRRVEVLPHHTMPVPTP